MTRERSFEDGDAVSLDDLFGLNSSEPPREPKQPPASYIPPEQRLYSEPCRACRGYGRFVTISGRDLGPCRKCKGRGTLSYSTSPEIRAAAKANRQVRAERSAQVRADEIEAWLATHPEEFTWMQANWQSFPFALEMARALNKYGSLTDNQLAAVRRCILRDRERARERAAREALAPIADVSRIEQAFASARANHIKRPILRLDTFIFKMASVSSKWSGSIYVYENDNYMGRVTSSHFHGSRDCDEQTQARVLAVIEDPEKAAVAYGRRTSNCSCCGAELTNAASIERGIGPICASKWGW